MTDIYPVTIIRTRYGGAYEGGDWAAFNCDECDVPPDATGCDSECKAFWRDPKGVRVGVGGTPDQALAALLRVVEDSAPPWQMSVTRAPEEKGTPGLVIRTIRDWAGVRMDDRPIRRAVVNRMDEPTAPMTEEADRLRKASAAGFMPDEFRVQRVAAAAAEVIRSAETVRAILAAKEGESLPAYPAYYTPEQVRQRDAMASGCDPASVVVGSDRITFRQGETVVVLSRHPDGRWDMSGHRNTESK